MPKSYEDELQLLIDKVEGSDERSWEEMVDEDKREAVRNHRNNKALKENLERMFSFFNNSSICTFW